MEAGTVDNGLTGLALRDQSNPARLTQSIITAEARDFGGYRTFVIDPPWHYPTSLPGFAMKHGDEWKRPGSMVPYMTMTNQEIAELPILGLAGEAAHLYLWTTNTHIEAAFAIVKAWGFKYSTLLTWRKPKRGRAGFPTFAMRTEYVLFCRLGTLRAGELIDDNTFEFDIPIPDEWADRDDFYDLPRLEHSAKPPEFMEMFENVSPGPRIELFARGYRMDWRSIGIELNGQDIREDIAAEMSAIE